MHRATMCVCPSACACVLVYICVERECDLYWCVTVALSWAHARGHARNLILSALLSPQQEGTMDVCQYSNAYPNVGGQHAQVCPRNQHMYSMPSGEAEIFLAYGGGSARLCESAVADMLLVV